MGIFSTRSTFGGKKAKRISDRWTRNEVDEDPVKKWVDLAPREKPEAKKPKGLKQVSKKGVFNIFANEVLTLFFIKSGIERTCHVCFGKNYCGVIDRMHAKRRHDIPYLDWWGIFRVLPGGRNCHEAIDKRGRIRAERLTERFIKRMFKKVQMDERDIQALLVECGEEVKEADAKLIPSAQRFQHFEIEFQDPRPYPIDLEETENGRKIWTVEAVETK